MAYIIATASINTSQRMVLYRNFVIQEAFDSKTRADVWEWTHEDYNPKTFPATGNCQTLYECIDAVDAWHEQKDAA